MSSIPRVYSIRIYDLSIRSGSWSIQYTTSTCLSEYSEIIVGGSRFAYGNCRPVMGVSLFHFYDLPASGRA